MRLVRTAAAAALLTAVALPTSAQQYQSYQYQQPVQQQYQQPAQQYQYQQPVQQYQPYQQPVQQPLYQPAQQQSYQPYMQNQYQQQVSPVVEEESPERMIRRLVRGKWIFASAPTQNGSVITGLEGEVDVDLENGVEGKSPCNDFRSSIRIAPQDRRGGQLDFHNIQRTVKPCSTPGLENGFLARIDAANRYQISGSNRDGNLALVLFRDSQELMTLRRRPRQAQDNSPERMVRRLVRGKWIFASAPTSAGRAIVGLEGEVDLDLENGVQGKSPCNDFRSSLVLAPQSRRGGQLDFQNIQRTTKPCANPSLENGFLARIDAANRYEIVGNNREGNLALVLFRDTQELMTLKRPERRRNNQQQQPTYEPHYQPYNDGSSGYTPYYNQ